MDFFIPRYFGSWKLSVILEFPKCKRVMREKILLEADSLFVRFGVKSVTMDDIARELGISKKTIYQYFQDKRELVKICTIKQCAQRDENFEKIQGMAENAIEELVLISKAIRENILDLNPLLLMEIKKYYSESWKIFLEFKEDNFYKSLVKTIERGKAEGYFREEIDAEVLAIMRMQQMQDIFEATVYPKTKFDYKEVQIQLMNHFMHGLLTRKGKDMLDKHYKGKF